MARANQNTSLLTGAALAGVGLLLWSKKDSIFPSVVPAAPLPDPTPSPYTIPTPSAPPPPIVQAPVIVSPIAPAAPGSVSSKTGAETRPVVGVSTPYGTVIPSNFTDYETGEQGGQYNPNVPAPQLTDEQRFCGIPATSAEVAVAMARKPTWGQEYTTNRLNATRLAFCQAAGSTATTAGAEQLAWIEAYKKHRDDYKWMTGVDLIPPVTPILVQPAANLNAANIPEELKKCSYAPTEVEIQFVVARKAAQVPPPSVVWTYAYTKDRLTRLRLAYCDDIAKIAAGGGTEWQTAKAAHQDEFFKLTGNLMYPR